MTTTTRQDERLKEVGKSAMDSIRCLVAALECDYDRLEELKEDRQEFLDDIEAANEAHANCAHQDVVDAHEALAAWNAEHAEELAELIEAASANGNECTSREDAEQQIQEDALSAQVRSDWEDSADDFTPAEFCLLLTTGGPAVRIIGELDGGEVQSARLEVQDWGTPWTEHITTGDDNEALLTYSRCFYFGQ